MNRTLFGTDGVRGIAGQYPLDKAGAIKIGRAIGTHFAKTGESIVIACDPRKSSSDIVKYVTDGLNQVGVNVTYIGVLPTPGLAYITRENDEFMAGVMITASHNSVEYNGVKAFDRNGDKLPDETESKLNDLIEKGVPDRGKGNTADKTELVKQYKNFLIVKGKSESFSGLKIAIDTANGAASKLAKEIFNSFGVEVTALFDKPDGNNINEHCGATDPKTLIDTVIKEKCDLGIALDGDADRVLLIDNLGREVKGDYIMYILAVFLKLDGVVATEMSNQGFETSLNRKHIKVKRTKVGDRYVLEGLKETGYKLGGEQSGHIILYNLLATGDGLLAATQTVKAVSESGRSLAEWCDEVQLLPQALVNIPLSDKTLLESPEIKNLINRKNSELSDKGRLIIRPSGTEPLVRIMVEAPEAQRAAENIAVELQAQLQNIRVKV